MFSNMVAVLPDNQKSGLKTVITNIDFNMEMYY